MPDVTCPNCWLWQPLGRSTSCCACGAPLITPMGARVDQVWNPVGAAPISATGADPSGGAAYAPSASWMPIGYAGRPTVEEARGTDWVLWVRVALAVPSLLLAALVMLLGLLFQHITLPAAAGQVPQTVDIGPMVVIFLAIFLSITALIVWLARFAVFRAILLILIVVNVVSVLTQIGVAIPADRIALLVDVGWDIGYAALLILSLTSQRPQLR